MPADAGSGERHDRSPDGDVARLTAELRAVDAERRRLRAEVERIERSPLGRLIEPARTVRAVVARRLRRLRARIAPARRGAAPGAGRADRRARAAPPPPRLTGSELAWLARRRLRTRTARWSSTPTQAVQPSGAWLTPILVDYFGRDGSTATMALLDTSPEIVIDAKYPYEHRYFTYLWRWSRLLDRTRWPGALWTKDDVVSISQEAEVPLLGPPPWLPRELLEPAAGGEPASRRCFELVWGELSARAVRRAAPVARAGAAPRCYAEKHVNTWLVDLRELPPVRVIALLRDPRDTYASILAFEDKEPVTSFGIHDRWAGADRLGGVLDRSRQRLRWIADLLDDGSVPVIRYEDLVDDPEGVARRLERHLEVELDPGALSEPELATRHGSSTEASAARWRRDLDPATAERFTRELGPELRALGFDV